MKNLFGTVLLLATPVALAQSLSISRNVLNASNEPFISHQGSGEYDSYLTQEISFTPVKRLHKDLEKKLGLKLINRGEAHITVITPPEFWKQLRGYIDMNEIDKLAQEMKIQDAKFTIVCVGKGEKQIGDKLESTFYLVVTSPRLFEIRHKIVEKIRANGGNPTLFNPDNFYPHITLGYTKRDLFEDDGIIKDAATCVENVEIE